MQQNNCISWAGYTNTESWKVAEIYHYLYCDENLNFFVDIIKRNDYDLIFSEEKNLVFHLKSGIASNPPHIAALMCLEGHQFFYSSTKLDR